MLNLPRISRHACRPILVMIMIVMVSQVVAEETVTFVNLTKRTQFIWVWPCAQRRYFRPPYTLKPGIKENVRFTSGEEYYIVARDSDGRETPFGRYNFSALAKVLHPLVVTLDANDTANYVVSSALSDCCLSLSPAKEVKYGLKPLDVRQRRYYVTILGRSTPVERGSSGPADEPMAPESIPQNHRPWAEGPHWTLEVGSEKVRCVLVGRQPSDGGGQGGRGQGQQKMMSLIMMYNNDIKESMRKRRSENGSGDQRERNSTAGKSERGGSR